jgi:bacillolysin
VRGSIPRGRLLLIVLFAVAVLAPGAAMAQTAAQDPGGRQGENEGLLRRLDPARVAENPETGTVSLVGANSGDPIERPAGLSPGASPAAAARAHLEEIGPAFGIQDPSSEAELRETEAAGGGRSVSHFQQVYKGVPVLGGEINVQTTGSNELLSANGEALPKISVDTEPGVGAGEAREAALEAIAKQYERGADTLDVTEPELWVYDPALLGGPGPQIPTLVWRMEVTPDGFVDFNELVLVDAQVGNVVLNFDQVHNAKNRDTHDSNNTSAFPGTLVCNEANPCTDPNYDNDVRLAHRYAGETYDFYWTKHNRDSLNNAGMKLISTADYCDPAAACPYANAFWNGTQMAYGDGFAQADDVVGHELTHGVTDHESRLFYYYQSGAINESLSDVWGEFVDLSNTTGTDTATTRWLMGEDIPGIGAIRDMEDPGAFGDPDRMRSPNYYGGEDDGGGVHWNSGVNNKAAFLMTDGGSFNGRTVTPLGGTSLDSIREVSKIYYEAQANMLTSAGDYGDLHAVLQQACANLTGTSGITAADCAEVKDAVDATEMNLTPTAAPNPEAPVCPTGESATNLFSDDLENTASGNWTKQSISGQNHWYYPQNSNPFNFDATYATSGTTNMWGYNQGAVADSAIARTANVTPPIGKTTYLRFNHAYAFEDSGVALYDGGVLEYSTNNGTTWTDAGSLITDNGYTGTLSTSWGNPLGGRQAFGRESNGYISSRANLSSLAGQSVRFRFRIGTDDSVDDYGWFVDDVRVYTCGSSGGGDTSPPTVASVKPTAGQTGVSRATNVTVTFSEAMGAGSLNADTVYLVKSGGTARVPLTMTTSTDTGGRTVLRLDPFGPTTQKLAKSSTYKLTVEGAADADGLAVEDSANNEMAQDKTSSFKTKRR